MAPATNALILDFDRSVGAPVPECVSVDLSEWQESIRFGCRLADMHRLGERVSNVLRAQAPGIVFMGSGDFHHVTWMLLERFRFSGRPIRLVVLDNHPDNMRYPFGIHCGSWVWHASRLPFVAQIDVLGITSEDVEVRHGWENHLRNLRSGRVRYWCVGRDLHWMRSFGISGSRSFDSVQAMFDEFLEEMSGTDMPIYFSVDKDVLCKEDAHTNWDQGVMRLTELVNLATTLRSRIVGADVTGEVSVYRYRSLFKRMLSGLDAQTEPPSDIIGEWQRQHLAINRLLVEALQG